MKQVPSRRFGAAIIVVLPELKLFLFTFKKLWGRRREFGLQLIFVHSGMFYNGLLGRWFSDDRKGRIRIAIHWQFRWGGTTSHG
jgi:hypothetical protein